MKAFSIYFQRALLGLFLVAQCSATTLFHDYHFDGNLDDQFGGPSLVSHGGSVLGSAYYFGPNQGLSLSSALANPADYSIAIDFSFDIVGGYRRIIEFKNLTADAGFYDLGGMFTFYPNYLVQQQIFQPNVMSQFVLVRNATTATVSAYVDGVNLINFLDSAGLTVFTGPAGIIHFFQDETGGTEAAPGMVDRIRIFDGALTVHEVSNLDGISSASPVPEPATWLITASALAALAGIRRRRS